MTPSAEIRIHRLLELFGPQTISSLTFRTSLSPNVVQAALLGLRRRRRAIVRGDFWIAVNNSPATLY